MSTFSFFPSLLSFRFASREISTFGEIFSARKGERRLAAADEQFSVPSQFLPYRAELSNRVSTAAANLGSAAVHSRRYSHTGGYRSGGERTFRLGKIVVTVGGRVCVSAVKCRGVSARVWAKFALAHGCRKIATQEGQGLIKKKKFKKKVRRSVTLAFRFVPERKLKKERERLRRFG